MLEPQFVHLRVHSEYSITDSIVRINDIVNAASEDKQGALAISDLNNLFGLIRFYRTALNSGIKPIAGCDVGITDFNNRKKASRLLLLVKNYEGYLNLCELLSRAWINNTERTEINPTWFEEGLNKGLIALSGAYFSNISIELSNGNWELAKQYAKYWKNLFLDSFYIEIQRVIPSNEILLQKLVLLSIELNLPIVATHPIQFMKPNDFMAHEARVCISEGTLLADSKRVRSFDKNQFFHTQKAMINKFIDLPSALQNSVEIAKRCNLILEFGQPKLPNFPIHNGLSLDNYIIQKAKKGLEIRLQDNYPDIVKYNKYKQIYLDRLNFEISTIKRMGFSSYFLIVADFVIWAKNNGVPVGPGRGSGASSLVAYSLGITDLDPIRYNLLFERFLNPERISMPDFDIDFCQEGRDKVIKYVKNKYGINSVSQIVTFGTMAARAAVRDVGRVLDLGYTFTDKIAKLIPFKTNKHVTIRNAIEEEPILALRYQNDNEARTLLDLAQCVEGLTRNIGVHAGGILIAPDKLTKFCPLYTPNDETNIVSQYDKDDIEAIGLVKFDFLGLTTLSILNCAEQHIKSFHLNKINWKFSDIQLNDNNVFTILKKANTIGIFQLESRGMQRMLKDAQPDCFEDIIALISLYRPGPINLIHTFCARKHKKEKINYIDPRMKSILKETYGIIVYQEQVMQIAQIIGGYSLGKADMLRRAMGKKKPEEMSNHYSLFREGAYNNGLSYDKADQIFSLMEKFAGYGFNKSHAAAYALLSYYTAWFKTYYPAEFIAACMSYSMNDTDKIRIFFNDCKKNNISILPPDINESNYDFLPVFNTNICHCVSIRYGLGAIKGNGQSSSEEIIRIRSNSKFKDLFDFCLRVDKKIVNKRIMEALIRAGALDNFNIDRANLLASLPNTIEAAEQKQNNILQIDLFASDILHINYKLNLVKPWSCQYQLQQEKTVIGFFLSGHLYNNYINEVRYFITHSIEDLKEGKNKIIAGIVVGMRTQIINHNKYAILLLDDGTSQIEIFCLYELLKDKCNILQDNEIIVAQGKAYYESFKSNLGGLRFKAEIVMNIAEARCHFANSLILKINQDSKLEKLAKILASYRTSIASLSNNNLCPNYIVTNQKKECKLIGLPVKVVYNNSLVEVHVVLDDEWRINPFDSLLHELGAEYKTENIYISYK